MTTALISPKFQVVIPKALRESLKLTPGQRVDMQVHDGKIIMEPVPDIMALRGFLPPVDGVDVAQVPNDPEGPEWPGACPAVFKPTGA